MRLGRTPARWQSGYAAACKAVYVGSIPARASSFQVQIPPFRLPDTDVPVTRA